MNAHPRSPTPHPGSPGVTLIEMVGVLAALTIIGLILVPVLVEGYDRFARDRESTALARIATGLESHIQRNQTIPDGTGFAPAVAAQLGWQTASVLTNDRRLPRIYLIDPAVTNVLPIPFNQSPFGVTNTIPPGLGVIILSSISTPLPPGLSSGVAASSAAFQNIWNAPDNTIPAGWTWKGRGEDLRVQRVTLGTLFVPIVLNYDTYTVALTNQGRFTIGNSTTNVLPTSPSYVASFLRGSLLGLHHHAGTTGTLQVLETIHEPLSFVYERDAWRGALFLGRGMRLTSGLDIQAAHDLFVSSPSNVNAQGNPKVGPPTVVQAMSNYMVQYVAWRTAGYPASHAALDAAQATLESTTMDLLHKPSGGGGGK